MSVVFDGLIGVSYHQVSVTTADGDGVVGYDDAFAGQRNGQCGSGVAGALLLQVGLHTGQVPFRVEALPSEPPRLTAAWEDVVEVSIEVATRELVLTGLMSEGEPFQLPAAGGYRVRFAAIGMDAGVYQDAVVEGETAPDRYLLQWWPAPPSAELIVRVTSQYAAVLHGERINGTAKDQRIEFARSPDPPQSFGHPAADPDPTDILRSGAGDHTSLLAPVIPERFGSRRHRDR